MFSSAVNGGHSGEINYRVIKLGRGLIGYPVMLVVGSAVQTLTDSAAQ